MSPKPLEETPWETFQRLVGRLHAPPQEDFETMHHIHSTNLRASVEQERDLTLQMAEWFIQGLQSSSLDTLTPSQVVMRYHQVKAWCVLAGREARNRHLASRALDTFA